MTELNRSPGSGPRIVSFDLMSDDPDYYFVLTTALGDFAAQARAEAKEGTNPESNTRWAEAAEDALWRIEMALSGGHASSNEKTPGRAACEAFWAHMGTGPDGQPSSAAWDWARSQGTQDAWMAASRAAAEATEKDTGGATTPKRCWCGAVHPAGWCHSSGAASAYPASSLQVIQQFIGSRSGTFGSLCRA